MCVFVLDERQDDGNGNIWFQSALWMALALVAAIDRSSNVSAALFEIVVVLLPAIR
jgi:hypothetical protein